MASLIGLQQPPQQEQGGRHSSNIEGEEAQISNPTSSRSREDEVFLDLNKDIVQDSKWLDLKLGGKLGGPKDGGVPQKLL